MSRSEAASFRFTWNKTADSHLTVAHTLKRVCRLRFSFFVNDSAHARVYGARAPYRIPFGMLALREGGA